MGKGQNFGYILFGVISSVSPRRTFFQEISPDFILFPIPEIGFRAPGGQLSKPRVGIYLQAPTRIVHQMEMEAVHLEGRRHFQLLHHKGFVLEIPAHIQHHSTILKAGPVQDGATGYHIGEFGKHLQGLSGIEGTLLIGRLYTHTFLPYLHPVGLLQLPVSQFLTLQPFLKAILGDNHHRRQLCQLGR